MLPKKESCKACPLFGDGKGFVPADGSGNNGILLVGDAPDSTEAAFGKPFVGAAGFYLDRLLKRAGFERTAFRVHNILSCRPPNDWLVGAPWEVESTQKCRHFLNDTIDKMRPRVIVALGNTALSKLTTYSGINRYRGRVIPYPLPGGATAWVVPTYDPSFLLPRKGQANTSRFVGAVIRDLRLANRIAQEGFVRRDRSYIEDPKPDEFWMFVNEYEAALAQDPDTYLSLDIETPYKLKKKDEDDLAEEETEEEAAEDAELPISEPILRVSFAYRIGHAVSVPWQGPWLDAIRQLLRSPGRKITWNGARFDVPLLQAHGFEVAGANYDYMWGWHMLQSDLPKGLEYVSSLYTDVCPWKHEADSRPAWYNAVDADVALEIGIGVERDLRAANQWDIFRRHVVELDILLLTIGNNGVHINIEKQNALKATLQAEQERLIREAQISVPDSCRPTKRYKRQPESVDLEGRLFRAIELTGVAKFCSSCGAQVSNRTDHHKGKGNPCKKAKATLEARAALITEWDEILPFNPNSVKDLSAYATLAGHPLGVNHKTQRPTMDKKHVQTLAKKYSAQHPIYQIALDLRGIKKTLGTYVLGFAPDAAGKIYTTYGYYPSTGRLSSRAKNLQNISHKSTVPYAKEVRATIVPKPGCVFVEADSSAIEAVMTGHCMGSAEYIALAKKGIHDYLTCLEFKIPFTPESIKAFKAHNAERYEIARTRNKVVVHGTSYGMTPYLMYMSWPIVFPRIRDAENAQAAFFAACPGLAQWQTDVRMFAHKQGYLVNPWNYRHYFYDVYTKDKDKNIQLGSDGNRAVAFLPQSSAGAFMKDNVFLLAQTPFWPMPANGLVHDSYCLEVESTRIHEAVKVLAGILTRPVPELNGLRIGCEIKVGEDWAEMHTVEKVAA